MKVYCCYTKIGEIGFYSVSNNQAYLVNKFSAFLDDLESNRLLNKFNWSDCKEFDSTTGAVEFICSNVSKNIDVVILDNSIVIADFLKVFQKDTCRPFLCQTTFAGTEFSPIICKENNLYLRDSNTFRIENDAYIKNFLKIANRRDIYLSYLDGCFWVCWFVIFLSLFSIVMCVITWSFILDLGVILASIWRIIIPAAGAFVIFLMLSLIPYYIIYSIGMRAKYAYPKAPCITDEKILNNLKNYVNKSVSNMEELYKSYQLVMVAVRNFNQQSAHNRFIKNEIKDTNSSTNSIKRILVYTLNSLYYKHILSCRIETKKQFEENKILRALYDKFQCVFSYSIPAKGKLVFDENCRAYDKDNIGQWIAINPSCPSTRKHLSKDKLQSSEKFNAILELLRLYDTNLLKPSDKLDASLPKPTEQLIPLIDSCIECISQANTVESTSYAYKVALETYGFYNLALLASNGDPIKAEDILRQKLIAELEVKFNMEIQHEAKKALEDNPKIQANLQIDVLQANCLKIYGYCLDLYQKNEHQMIEFIDRIFSQEQAIATSAKELLIEEFIAIAISSHITDSVEAEIAILKTIIASKEIDKEILQFFLPQIIKKLVECSNVDWNYVLNVVEKYITSYNAADILYTLYDPDYSACSVLLETEEEKYIYHFDPNASKDYLNNAYYIKTVKACINEMNVDWYTMDPRILAFKKLVIRENSELQGNVVNCQKIIEHKQEQLLHKQSTAVGYVHNHESNQQKLINKQCAI